MTHTATRVASIVGATCGNADTRSPVPYFGSKGRLASAIVATFPPHRHYVEPFAGSLAVLLAKPRSRAETVNDLDGDLLTFWRVLRDQPDELARLCSDTPHSRAERELAHDRRDLDDLERARRVFVCLTQGRTGSLNRTGWRHNTTSGSSDARRLPGYVSRIRAATTRIAGVSLECRPAVDVIRAYGQHSDTLIYADPPYAGLASRGYARNMTSAAAHQELAEVLHQCRATVVLSGYRSDLYDAAYADWWRAELPSATSQGGQRQERTEVIWSNRPFRYVETPTYTPLGNETCGCGKVLIQPATGRRRRHCSAACRVAAHRRRGPYVGTTDVCYIEPRSTRTGRDLRKH